MTRSTFKALWVGGGGVLATWLAVSPQQGAPAASSTSAVQQSAAVTQASAEQLNAQADRLRARAAEVTLRPSTRNPFRFNSTKSRETERAADDTVVAAAVESAMPVAPPLPAPALSGIALEAGKRIAIITIDGEIYLVGDGDSFGSGYTVVSVDPEAALIRDAAGAEQRLILR